MANDPLNNEAMFDNGDELIDNSNDMLRGSKFHHSLDKGTSQDDDN